MSVIRWSCIICAALYCLLFIPLWGMFLRAKPFEGSGLAHPLARHILSQRQQSREKARIKTVNLLMPQDYQPLIKCHSDLPACDHSQLTVFKEYYQALTEFLTGPQAADAFALLGFCLSMQKDDDGARRAYRKSLEINPVFIGTYYNLALLEFRNRNYQQAVVLINTMMKLDSSLSFKVLMNSKIYGDILREGQGIIDPVRNLKNMYADALRVLVMSFFHLERYSEMLSAVKYARQAGFLSDEELKYYEQLALEHQGYSSKKRENGEAGFGQGNQNFMTVQDPGVKLF